MKNSCVLSNDQILQKTKRIAYQIFENNFDKEAVFVGGIVGTGYTLAKRIAEHLTVLSGLKVTLFEIKINKQKPLEDSVVLSIDDNNLNNQSVIVVDDVINSGRTMIYAVNRILETPVASIKIATLVNRTHRRFPVKADFVGLNIATTIQNSINVDLGENNGAFLA